MVFAVLGLLCARTSTQGSLAPQRVCLFSFPSPAASASLEGFQPKRGDGHFHRPRCRPYPTALPSAIWSAMFTAHSPTPCPNAKPSHYATASALVGVPMFRSPQPTSTSPPSHPAAQVSPRQRAQPCSPFALASPQPPTRWARARLSASLAPEMACFAQNLFSAGSFL